MKSSTIHHPNRLPDCKLLTPTPRCPTATGPQQLISSERAFQSIKSFDQGIVIDSNVVIFLLVEH
ncbi:hypothetical protein J6590_062564 [Homalodisca vitripennis]|nr:hypothetical protein J6590_062564 [Homalodisca vitripennis]